MYLIIHGSLRRKRRGIEPEEIGGGAYPHAVFGTLAFALDCSMLVRIAITSQPLTGPVTISRRIMAATRAGILPGLTGQSLKYRGMKIVTGEVALR